MNKCKKQSDIDFTESVQDGKCNRLDLISRRDVLALAKDVTLQNGCKHRCIDATMIHELPSAETEIHEIDYRDCSNAMLKMWIDNVLTDREYNHIMDKLNTYWAERRTDEQVN